MHRDILHRQFLMIFIFFVEQFLHRAHKKLVTAVELIILLTYQNLIFWYHA